MRGEKMLKKIMTQLAIFSLLFLTWLDVQNLPYSAATSRISGPWPVFPNIQIELLKSDDPGISDDALKQTAFSLVEYISPAVLTEPWQARFLFLNLCGSDEDEVVIAVSLLPDTGIMAVLQKQSGYYVLLHFLDNLLPLAKLDKLPFLDDREILLTREDYDEMAGAFSESRTLTLWGWEQKKIQPLWKERCFWEVNFLNTWPDPAAHPRKWIKLTQNLTLSYSPDPSPHLLVKGIQTRDEAPAEREVLPAPHLFTPHASRPVQDTYRWNGDWHLFALGAGTLELPHNPAVKCVITKDLSDHLESMYLTEDKYEIVTAQGNPLSVDKKYVKLDP